MHGELFIFMHVKKIALCLHTLTGRSVPTAAAVDTVLPSEDDSNLGDDCPSRVHAGGGSFLRQDQGPGGAGRDPDPTQ